MTEQQRIEIERACERLVTRYCHLVDHGEADRIAGLFTDDGVWTAPGVRMEGRGELEAGFGAREKNKARASRHVCNNLLVDVHNAESAEGTVYLTLYRHDGAEGQAISPLEGPAMVGEYRDQFVLTDAGWRIKQRDTSISFLKPGLDGA